MVGDREKLQAFYNDLLALQDHTDQVPLAKALDAVGFALEALSNRPANVNECPSCKRVFVDGETCSRGGCPMGGDV